jgi:hypothetical protein
MGALRQAIGKHNPNSALLNSEAERVAASNGLAKNSNRLSALIPVVKDSRLRRVCKRIPPSTPL